ncbi:MAG: phytanoyl-CoA dioxygenase family protein [Gammaproteobacteria bacterium]|nr:phytanoyl-CoA dioxygenase family protein [Gammaproteobacteria bacterium]MDH3448818.1 phytanoyl-CoA dioxygenase family protein [Gammaproteobacteria bacterium]
MPKILTTQQVTQYREQGFLSPIDVMPEDEALRYQERLRQAERDNPRDLNAENRNNPHLAFTFLDELAHHPVILDAVEDLIGPDYALWGSVLFIKEPRSSHFVSWHQDATYVGVSPHNYVTAWLALTPSNPKTGCMSMIPGSHRDDIKPHLETFHEDNILTRGQSIQQVDASVAVDLVLVPGQMSLHHCKVIHGSQPNRGRQRRVGFALQGYVPGAGRQYLGANLWMPIRGNFMKDDFIELRRPVADMDPAGVAERHRANQNWADILYQGASHKRAY